MLFEDDQLFLILKTMLSTVMTLLMMTSLTNFRYTKRRVLLCFALYLAYVMGVSVLLVQHLPWLVFLRIFLLSITLPGVVLIYLLAKDSVTQAIFNYATQVDLFILLSVTATLLNTALHGNQLTDLLLRFVLLGSAALLELRFLRRDFCRLTDTLRNNWLPMALIPVAFCILLLLCGLYPVHYTESLWAVVQIYAIFSVMGIVYFVLLGSLIKSYRQLESQLETDVMNAQLYTPQRYVEVLLKNRQALRNIRQGVAQADALLQSGDIAAARKVLQALPPPPTATDAAPVCANPYINEVISYYSDLFAQHHIHFTLEVDMRDAQPPEEEVCLILNNALQNALEASLALPEAERAVRLQIIPRQGQLLMRVSNRFAGKLTLRNGLPSSTKQGYGHGYGLTSIRAAAVGAGGDMVFNIKKGNFVLDARVRATAAKEKAAE